MREGWLTALLVVVLAGMFGIQASGDCSCGDDCSDVCDGEYTWIGYGNCTKTYYNRCDVWAQTCTTSNPGYHCQQVWSWSIFECRDIWPYFECEVGCRMRSACFEP